MFGACFGAILNHEFISFLVN